MHPAWMSRKAADNVAQVFNIVLSSFSFCILTATAIVRRSGGLAFIRYSAYWDCVPCSSSFICFAMFPDGDDE